MIAVRGLLVVKRHALAAAVLDVLGVIAIWAPVKTHSGSS
jgi:hypothetical protein